MSITCAQILSRMLVYYLVLILLVPVLAKVVVDRLQVPHQSYGEMAAEQFTSMILFFLIIPTVWNKIDEYSAHRLKVVNSSSSSNSSSGTNAPASVGAGITDCHVLASKEE